MSLRAGTSNAPVLFGAFEIRTIAKHLILPGTPRFEITKADDHPLYVRSTRLTDIAVTDYEKCPFYQRIPDTGIEVTGRYMDARENAYSFIGLGKDAAGEKFKTMLIHAVQSARQ